MELLFQCKGGARIVALSRRAEVAKLVQGLEDIAQELDWQPGTQLHDNAGRAWHLAVQVEEELAGGLQAVIGGRNRLLPYRLVWPEVDAGEPGSILHITMLALTKEHRGQPHLFGALCVELWRRCVAAGVHTILLEATPSTLRVYRRLGWPLEIIGGLRAHWGEECYLCRMGVEDVADALCHKARRAVSYCALIQQAYRNPPAQKSSAQPLTALPCL